MKLRLGTFVGKDYRDDVPKAASPIADVLSGAHE